MYEQECPHCCHQNAKEYHWPNPAIIVAADFCSSGLYNFIVPLRSHARPKKSLNPIVLLCSSPPDNSFLDMISFFPLVYWMKGSIDSIEDLLRAGINLTENVVVVNKETSNSREEDTLADCNTIVSVQTIFRLFPKRNIITEITHSPNMRFMQFRPDDLYSLSISKQEKKERQRGSNLYYMFRLPFAAGNVFSASMLDALLYQAFVKDYIITFVRLLLGVDMAVGSGHLASVTIKKEDLWIRTYGRLYQKLCSTACEIPIGIYRTQMHSGSEMTSLQSPRVRTWSLRNYPRRQNRPVEKMSLACAHDDDTLGNGHLTPERQEIIQMVKCRMQTQGLPLEDYNDVSDRRSTISYVIINPSYDLKLELGDIVYVIRPSSLSPQPSPLTDERKLLGQGARQDPTGSEHADLSGADTPANGDLSGADTRSHDHANQHQGDSSDEDTFTYSGSGRGGRSGAHDNDLTILSQDSAMSAPAEIPVIYFDQAERQRDNISSSVPDNLGHNSVTFAPTSLQHTAVPDSSSQTSLRRPPHISDDQDEVAQPRFTLYPSQDQGASPLNSCVSEPAVQERTPVVGGTASSISFPGLKGTIV
ncbi:potassium channel subfamily t member 1 [Plakobranchus ocellatus]|uniref:Potassium channel subfamily t member 1 n=1 Tax=Plakobranchus ocellatus TaxID=259542 RepID=A0AAV4A0H5_9GAST|nr:potassium channel subfamily t member 1 [Plakobranchus ocellatus]